MGSLKFCWLPSVVILSLGPLFVGTGGNWVEDVGEQLIQNIQDNPHRSTSNSCQVTESVNATQISIPNNTMVSNTTTTTTTTVINIVLDTPLLPLASAPWLVKILKDLDAHLYTGVLVTWQKVLTTCGAATDQQIQFVTASFGAEKYQIRNIARSYADSRCELNTPNKDVLKRYDIGTITVDLPFAADNYTIGVVQFPTLNKRKYLELTDQLAANEITCRFFEWDFDRLKDVHITAVESYQEPSCQIYSGVHEFICSVAPNHVNNFPTTEGSPVICGEDIYGIVPKQVEAPVSNTTNNKAAYVWLRLDEFVHLFVDENPDLIAFINNVDY